MATKSKARTTKKSPARQPATKPKKKPDYLALDIGRRIGDARKQAGIGTIAALHKVTTVVDKESKGISQPVLKGYEDGAFKPGARELRLLSLSLNVSANWLLFGKQAKGSDAEPGPAAKDTTVADYARAIDAEKSTVFVAMFLLKLHPLERDALLQLLEAVLRTRLGDKQFLMFFESIKAATELTVGSEGVESIAEAMFNTLPGEAKQQLVARLRDKAAELGLPFDEARDALGDTKSKP